MSETMKNTNATVITIADVARYLNLSINTVKGYLSPNRPGDAAKSVRDFAKGMGYKSRAELKAEREAMPKPPKYYYSTAFSSQAEGIAYAKHLREQGYGNMEIAKKAGVCSLTIRRWIGPAPIALSNYNRAMACKLRGQKAKLRKAAVRHVKVAEFNAKAQEREELMSKLTALEAELKAAAPEMQALRNLPEPTAPAIQMETLTPTPIM